MIGKKENTIALNRNTLRTMLLNIFLRYFRSFLQTVYTLLEIIFNKNGVSGGDSKMAYFWLRNVISLKSNLPLPKINKV